ncbi:hypothetical protein NLG97_g1138 [Lecanicillium saksenae]|uniref:Uncharacterized protein n=1 Tax=Lecanicillium saksenae TaxID=468837 RepID=A0ACC1R814_9HYPO|nr:hypothetical protein NLG97_g1138 [Lecanicillium saksenae]
MDYTTHVFTYKQPDNSEDRPILVDADRPGRQITFADYKSLVKRIAVGLQRYGVGDQDCVGLLSHNDLYYYVLGDGAVAAGAIYTGVPTFVKQAELETAIKTSGMKWLFAAPEFLDLALAAAKATGMPPEAVLVYDPPGLDPYSGAQASLSKLLEGADEASFRNANEGKDQAAREAIRFFTSGTTGSVKAAIMSHEAQIARFDAITAMPMPEKFLLMVGMYHASGILMHSRACAGGFSVHITRSADAASIIDKIRSLEIASTMVSPRLMDEMVARLGSASNAREHLASLAALRRLTPGDKSTLGLTKESTVVLLSTEGLRVYDVPHDVSQDDPVALTQALVRINSANPGLGSEPGPGETEIARFICSWFEYRDIDAHWIEPVKGRPSVVGVAKGSGGGRRLLLNGHTDTVTLLGYTGDPLDPRIENGKLYGRGSADMKSGLAAQMVAAANLRGLQLAGDVVVTAVADEELESLGTGNVLEAGWRADAAIVSECTDMAITRAHKGFVWLEIDVHGTAAHGSRPDLGYDAIAKSGYVLVELDRYAARLQQREADAAVGPPSAHASIIQGGEEVSSYPAKCTITVERRTVASENPAAVELEVRAILDQIAASVAGFKFDLRVTFSRPPFHMAEDAPLTQLVRKHAKAVTLEEPNITGAPYWTDSALLLDTGIPTILFGPRGEGFHGKDEFVYTDSIVQTTRILTQIAEEFCA